MRRNRLATIKTKYIKTTKTVEVVTIKRGADAERVFDILGNTTANHIYNGPDIELEFVERGN